MANDPAQDRYDPPKVGSEYEEDKFSEINPGELFRFWVWLYGRVQKRRTTRYIIQFGWED